MQASSYIALSQQTALSRSMDILANNLANASTPAFKGERPIFQEFLAKGAKGEAVSYVQDTGVTRDMKQGDLSLTSNPLDVGIQGDGYLSVDTDDGTRYTRNGRFQLGANGQLQNVDGHPVLDAQGKPISIPANSGQISIAGDGTVSVASGPVGKIGLSHFDNPQQLVAAGANLFVTDATPTTDTTSTLQQGAVESSNIQPIVEMTRMLSVQRAYSSAQQMVDSEDTRVKNAIDKLSQAA